MPVQICLDPIRHVADSFAPMQIRAETMATKKAAKRKVGRPKGDVALTPITTNFDPEILAAIERARLRREKAMPGVEVTTSAAIRGLLLKAIAAEEASETQTELPLTFAQESSTKKS